MRGGEMCLSPRLFWGNRRAECHLEQDRARVGLARVPLVLSDQREEEEERERTA
jgi:hypothetical protein